MPFLVFHHLLWFLEEYGASGLHGGQSSEILSSVASQDPKQNMFLDIENRHKGMEMN